MNIAFNSQTLLASFASRDSLAQSAELVSMGADEELVLDGRSERRPAEQVEDRLSGMLKGDSVMISQLRTKSLIAHRA